jgi:hypothetical protein
MSRKERERKSVFDQVGKEGLKLTEAAAALGVAQKQLHMNGRNPITSGRDEVTG